MVKLPKVTIAIDEEGSLAFGKISPALVIGFGIHFTWMFLVQFSAAHLFLEGAAEGTATVSHVFSLCVFILTLLAYAAFIKQARRLFDTPAHRNRNRLVAALATAIGGFLLFGCSVGTPVGWACIVASGLLTGVGSAVLLMSYGVSFGMLDSPTIAMGTALSLIVASVAFLALAAIGAVSPLLSAVLAALIPLAEFFCLRSCSRQLVDQLSFASCTFPVRKLSFALHIFAPSFFIGFAIAGIRRHALASSWLPNMEVWGTLALVAACLVTGILILLVAIAQHSTVNYMFRTLLPVSALCMALALFDGPSAGVANIGVLFAGYLVMEGACWMFYADISQRYRISAFQAFGVGRGALALGTLVYTLTLPALDVATSAPLETAQRVVIMLVALCIGFAMLPTNKEMLKSLKRGTHCPALAFDEDFLVAPAMIPDDPERAKELFPAEAPSSTSSQPSATFPSSSRPSEASGEIFATPGASPEAGKISPLRPSASGRDDKVGGPSASGRDDEMVCHPERSDGAPSPCHPERSAQRVVEGSPDDPQLASQEANRQGRFRRQCEMVADRYLLSRREAEVLFLLAKGRNAAFIQEKLFISEGTARTHMRHIYAKLNVHSQKELMDLVDSEATE